MSDFVQVVSLAAMDAENDFALPLFAFEHRLIDFSKVVFLEVQKSDY
jgi:hypothetical protein